MLVQASLEMTSTLVLKAPWAAHRFARQFADRDRRAVTSGFPPE
jgi:hypothetical protein